MSAVYWIHCKDHTDMFTQGYIGVSKELTRRYWYHKNKTQNEHLKNAIQKYGWDNLVKTVILVADEAYCMMIEAKLRAEDKIGWNIVAGGNRPPKTPWNKGKKASKKIVEHLIKIGIKKNAIPWNKGLKMTENQKKKQFNLANYVKEHGPWNKGLKMNKGETQ